MAADGKGCGARRGESPSLSESFVRLILGRPAVRARFLTVRMEGAVEDADVVGCVLSTVVPAMGGLSGGDDGAFDGSPRGITADESEGGPSDNGKGAVDCDLPRFFALAAIIRCDPT